MDQSYSNYYGYVPVYHQLQPTQMSPPPDHHHYEQQHQPQYTITTPQVTPDPEASQNIPNFSSFEYPEPQPQQLDQKPQFSFQNENFPYFNQNSSYIPSIFNPHQFQPPMPMWHGQEYPPPQVVPQYPPINYFPQPYRFPPPPVGYPVGYARPPPPPSQPEQQEAHLYSCVDCNKSFMSISALRRHMTTRVHLNKVKKEVGFAEGLENKNSTLTGANSITDLSEAEVVFIDKIDKELSSIDSSSWNGLKIEPILSSPLPTVSSSSSPDMVEKLLCQICNKTFAKRCYFTQHNKTAHVGYKPFKCGKCGKKYLTKELLDEHLLKHDGEKPFKCEMCIKSFNHKTDLKRHMILHTAEKPHVCEQCGKGFIRKDHLQKHLMSHAKKMQKLRRQYTSNSRN